MAFGIVLLYFQPRPSEWQGRNVRVGPGIETRASGDEGHGDKISCVQRAQHTLEQRSDVIVDPHHVRNSDAEFLLYVHSTPRHFWKRDMIRRTWGNPAFFSSDFRITQGGNDSRPLGFNLMFVVGLDQFQLDNKESLDAIFEESCLHGDILVANFLDTYQNLTLKGLRAMSWIDKNLALAHYVMKVDDDVLLNTYAWMENAMWMAQGSCQSCILCKLWFDPPVQRQGKWETTPDEYPRENYPSFCSGAAYLMSREVMGRLLAASKTVPHYRFDDVYFTGILAETLGIKRVDLNAAYFWLYPTDYQYRPYHPTDGLYVAHGYDFSKWESTWFAVADRYRKRPDGPRR